jgi:glutamine synthetase
MAESVAALRERLAACGVHTLLVQFTDAQGVAKGKWVPLEQLGDVIAVGAGFAGPSIWGTGLGRTGKRSEYYARGDAQAVQALPWMPGYARIVGDGYVDGAPFDGCPRQVLKRAIGRLSARGWTLQTGLEPEFFLLRRDANGAWAPADDRDRLDKPSYDLKSLPRQAPFLRALHETLAGCGLDVLQLDHEDAHGQYEVNFKHADALRSADNLMLFKQAAHALAERQGDVFSMMPKPFANQPGSGLHFHVSLWEGARSLFEDAIGPANNPRAEPDDDAGTGLSALGRHFIAGVLHHAAPLCALAAPTVNSYKRLVVGTSLSGTSWAPVYVAHGPNNRTATVRTLPGRFEWRVPDAAANPYLATAALIAAGLDGIDRRLDPGPACSEDLFALSMAEVRARGIALLPQSLEAALEALEDSELMRQTLGATLHGEFVRLKRDEWLGYARHVSAWELDRYAAHF